LVGKVGGAELLRSQGLVADGPVRWGSRVPARGPGVYVVELPEPLAKPPVDHRALRDWIDRVPTLELDGHRPTPHELAARLEGFWLPSETVVYVGRTSASLAGRLAAFYGTPLGDPRPHAGGHWLKTLSILDRLLLWWAETDAPEEYEDALLTAFSSGIDGAGLGLDDPSPVLPFANLQTALGVRKQHGISGSLLPAIAGSPGDGTESAPVAAGARPASRPSRAGRAASARRASRPRQQPVRPVVEAPQLSSAGMEQLRAELNERTEAQRPQIIARIKAARELGDLRENADYEAARREQSFNEGRIQAIEGILRHAVVLEQPDAEPEGRPVRLGSTVSLESPDGATSTYAIVSPTEADPAQGRISDRSPIGAALIGRRQGDEVSVRTPSGEISYRIVEVR
jgi:transcription elongation factor GreA